MATVQDFHDQLNELRRNWDVTDGSVVVPSEQFWVDHQKWLESCGYLLRPRYSPDWIPSWKGTKKSEYSCEDGQDIPAYRAHLMDATRLSDGTTVCLKRIFTSWHPEEVEIGLYFSKEPLASDPRNHCIPMLDVLKVPGYEDMLLLVMPFFRPNASPRFLTVGEAMEFFRQVFEGLQFMHEHHVAHRDCAGKNIMMDATTLYPNGHHPYRLSRNRNFRGYARHYTRTERPPKYYLIDFGISSRYDSDLNNGPPLETPIRGCDKTVPEFQGELYYMLSDPFATDVYYVGNMVQENFIATSNDFDFMIELITDMTQERPSERPTMDRVVTRFERIYASRSISQLRSRIVRRDELKLMGWWHNIVHFIRLARFTLLRIPPVPSRSACTCLPF